MQARAILVVLILAAAFPWPTPASANVMADDAWVVVAVVDSGINPYHREFAAATFPESGVDFSLHPSTYISGYPASSAALTLTLTAPDYATARAADAAKWGAIAKNTLRWIPGTKIVGAIDTGDDGFTGVSDPTPILDDYRHGTAVASLAVGNTLGLCARCLLVVVEDPAGLRWATEQLWIDVVVNSWGDLANAGIPFPDERAGIFNEQFFTKAGAECGQTILFASGNGYETFTVPEQTYTSNTLGPAWVLRVGGYVETPSGRVPMWGTGKPVDLLGKGAAVVSAGHATKTGTIEMTGTSAAAPWAGGVLAETLRLVRDVLGDSTEGRACAGQVLAEGGRPGSAADGSALGDGRLTRSELWAAVLAAAKHSEFEGVYALPLGIETEMLAPMNEGFGTVDAGTSVAAHARLLTGIPARPEMEPFRTRDLALRNALWGPFDVDGDGTPDAAATSAVPWVLPLA